ncbi:hypothetical protein E4U59_006074 [Claviceps monticola]|nr:hypothetical protein E4U59_006074 [Claviceps monticola]
MRRHLQVIWPLARGAKQALVLVQEKFPDALLNRQDIINEYRLWQQREQNISGCRAHETHTDEASFSRVLNQLEALFESKGIHIKLWETEDDGAFINALNMGFLEARIILYSLHMNKDVPQEKLFMFRVTPSAECSVDNNNHSATAAFFTCYAHVAVLAKSRATAAASPWVLSPPPSHLFSIPLASKLDRSTSISHQRKLLYFFATAIANYYDRSLQQRQLPAFPGPQSHQQAPLHSFQSHHQPHAPRSIDNRALEQHHEGKFQRQIGGTIQPRAQPVATAASNSGPRFRAPSTPIDADESFGFSLPARQYSWAGGSMLYHSRDM